MKKIGVSILLTLFGQVLFAQKITWQEPEKGIILQKEGETIAKIVPDPYEKTLRIELGKKYFRLDFNNISNKCKIFNDVNEQIGDAKKVKIKLFILPTANQLLPSERAIERIFHSRLGKRVNSNSKEAKYL